MRIWATVGTALGLLISGSGTPAVFAQDVEVMELDDAIYPVELILPLRGEPARPRRFAALGLLAGFDARYQFRNEFGERDVLFLRTTATYYASRLQLSVKATGFRAQGPAVTEVRVRTQIGYYTTTGADRASRVQLSWDVRSSTGSGVSHDVGIHWDYAYRLFRREFIGGFAFAWTPVTGTLYLGGASRFQALAFRNGASIDLGFGVGIDDLASMSVNGNSVLDFAKGEVAVRIPVTPLHARIHVAYAPAYRYRLARWNHEVGAFVEVPIAARLF